MLVISKNKRALRDFEIIESFEAGLVLTGDEIKSIRDGKISLQGAFAKIAYKDKGSSKPEAFLINSHFSGAEVPERSRKLLMGRKEINRLLGKTLEKKYTLVPIKIYLTGKGLAKVEIGIAKGLKKFDKRQRLKEKHKKRNLEREL